MQALEKILKEIEQRVDYYRDHATLTYVDICAGLREAEGIIRKHMDDGYDGWIPVGERLPEVGEYVLGTNEYDEVMIYRYGWNSRHSRKMFFHECGAAAIITAWMPLPEPYRPKSKTPEEMQEWKERMLQNFMKKGAM